MEQNFRIKKGLILGVGKNESKSIIIDNGSVNKPELRYNTTTNVWEYSNDAITFKELK